MMIKALPISFYVLISAPLFAADVPVVEEGIDKYDEVSCVERYKNNCISSVCLTSEARDCQEKCLAEAKDKCSQAD